MQRVEEQRHDRSLLPLLYRCRRLRRRRRWRQRHLSGFFAFYEMNAHDLCTRKIWLVGTNRCRCRYYVEYYSLCDVCDVCAAFSGIHAPLDRCIVLYTESSTWQRSMSQRMYLSAYFFFCLIQWSKIARPFFFCARASLKIAEMRWNILLFECAVTRKCFSSRRGSRKSATLMASHPTNSTIFA